MHLDLHVWRFDWAGSPAGIGPGVADLAERAEAMGIRTLSFMDHFFQMEAMAPADDPMLEGYTALGFVAGRTERLRLRLLVTGVTYRHPGLLAKTVTTLDVLSGGRAELGIGAAWYDREHAGLGVPFPPVSERFERLEEALQICLQMWSDDDGPYDGRHYQLAETLCRPAPVSSPRPRIMIGGGGERKTLRLVARYADACNLFGDPREVAHKLDVLRRHCEDVGRDPNEIEVTAMFRNMPPDPGVDDVVRSAEEFAAVGVTSLVISATGADPAAWMESTFGPAMERLGGLEPIRL
jgi:F420-dependent oxidoreductase-like protein